MRRIFLVLMIGLGGVAPNAHAMLPEGITGGQMEMKEMDKSDAVPTVSATSQIVCFQRTDPTTGVVQYTTATLDAASQLGATNIALGPCPGNTSGYASGHYGVGYLPEAILRGGIPQSVLQTVIQVVLSAFYNVLDIGDDGGHRIHT